jgi:TfoX/Sxy family transcriptional regulator of competence genes
MPYSQELDARLAAQIATWEKIGRKKMFGGVCYLVRGNMFCGVYKEFLILRLGEAGAARALGQEGVRPFDITGRPMKGWVMVPETVCSWEQLQDWLHQAKIHAEGLPQK